MSYNFHFDVLLKYIIRNPYLSTFYNEHLHLQFILNKKKRIHNIVFRIRSIQKQSLLKMTFVTI